MGMLLWQMSGSLYGVALSAAGQNIPGKNNSLEGSSQECKSTVQAGFPAPSA